MNSYVKLGLTVLSTLADEALIAASIIWKPMGIVLPKWIAIPFLMVFIVHHLCSETRKTMRELDGIIMSVTK